MEAFWISRDRVMNCLLEARGRLVGLAFVLLCSLLSVAIEAENRQQESIGGILSRSYESSALSSILGRSTNYASPVNKLPEIVPPQEEGLVLDHYAELIDHYSVYYGLDPNLVRAVIQAESGGNPQALSPKGAAGLMQLMPDTANQMGATDRFDPEQNIASGTRYLRSLLDRFHSVELALWAYNAGPGAVRKGVLPLETREYVPQVLRLKRHFARREGS